MPTDPVQQLKARVLTCCQCGGVGLLEQTDWSGKDYVTCDTCDGTGEVVDPRDRPTRKRWWPR